MRISLLTLGMIVFLVGKSLGQSIFLEGYIYDRQSNAPLPFANIWLKNAQKGTDSDENGYFTLISPQKKDTLIVSFLGYYSKVQIIDIHTEKPLKIHLEPSSEILKTIEVRGKQTNIEEVFQDMAVSRFKVDKATVILLPTLTGEPDYIKTMLLFPGATKGVEGTSDIFVRGGDADQNLVLFNGATVYNTGHLFGFLSVFNPYATSDATLLTGGFPAEYGGRLSSIIDIQSRKPTYDQFSIEGGIGTIASNLATEIPIVKDKLSLSIAGRRTYIDQLVKLFDISLPYYFYDVNAQLDYKISDQTELSYHFYRGDDILSFFRGSDDSESASQFRIENTTQTLTLNHQFNQNLISHTNLYFTRYNYDIFNSFQDNSLQVISDINDLGFQQTFTQDIDARNQLKYGLSLIRHRVDPNLIDAVGEISELIPSDEGTARSVLESALFASWKYKFSNFTTELGLRLSSAFIENQTYVNPEPRINFRWQSSENSVIKASYTRMYQYLTRISSSSFALPTDIWYPVTPDIKPQFADQWSIGYQYIFDRWDVLLSVDTYYKRMQNLIAFREGTNLAFNNDFEEALLQGKGNSYGLELLIKKESGKFRGWLAYTLSWSNRQFDELNNGNSFRARYDRRHNLSLVGNYSPNKRFTFSLIWEYISGARFTPLIGYSIVPNAALTGVDFVPIYPERNSVGLNDAHRLDLSITLHGKPKPHKKWYSEWQFSFYNVYNRATPVAINLVYDDVAERYFYEQPGLFGLLPSFTYRFKFTK